MPEKVDRALLQTRIRMELRHVLGRFLSEAVERQCLLTGDDAWTLRYSYAPVAAFPDVTICSGQVVAQAKSKYARLIKEHRHRFAFCVRVRGRYDMDVALNRIAEGVP